MSVNSTEYTSIDSFKDIFIGVSCYFSLILNEGDHERVIIDVISFKEFAIHSDLLSKYLGQLSIQLYFFISLHPILIFQFCIISSRSSVKTAFKIIYFLDSAFLLGFYFAKDVLHANEIYGIYFLFVNVYFQLIKTINSNNQRVWIVNHMFVIVTYYFCKEDILVLG